MKRAAIASVMAFLLAVAVAAPAHGADIQPTPPPVRDLTPASPTPPPSGISNPHTYPSTCTGWYLQKDYAYSWPSSTSWWEAECDAYDPSCWPACEVNGNVALLVDFYYWDGSSAVFYGEQYYQDWSVGTTCLYWLDSATGLQYQYDTPACPWTGPGNAAPFPGWHITCSTVYDCTFDATDSFASDGIASYGWDFGDGSTQDGRVAQHSYAAVGTYVVTLTVTDNGGLVAATSGALRIDIPPIASFTYTCTGWTCTFDARASSDPDGTVQRYYWYFGEGPSGAGPSVVQHTYTQAGSYNVILTVVDDGWVSSRAQQTVVISEPNPDIPPVASFTTACTVLRCHFDPSASHDPDGSIIKYDWTFVDGNNAGSGTGQYTAAPLDYSLPHDGTWVVTLSVTDNQFVKGSVSQTLTLTDLPPSANFTSTCSALACNFDGSSSTDDVRIQSYSWDFGDGGTATTATPQHSYANAGTYTVTLSVNDDVGLVGTVSKTVSVVATIPTASFTVTCTGGSCIFDASASADVGGTLVNYSWTLGDATTGQGKVVQHTYSAGRTYTVTLTVTDSGGVTATATRTASAISLSATSGKVSGQRQVSLSWAGSNAAAFDVYRNGVRITTVSGTSYTDTVSKVGASTYKVCESGSNSMCSNSVTVNV